MKRSVRVLAITALASAFAVTIAMPAAAKWYDGESASGLPSSLQVQDAKVAKDGWSVDWKMKVVCPAGEDFLIERGKLIQRNPASIPALYGEDIGITTGFAETGGVCTGKPQTVTLTLPILETYYEYCRDDPTVPVSTCSPSERVAAYEWVPMTPADPVDTSSFASLWGYTFNSVYCAAPNCEPEIGSYIRFK